MRCTGFLFDRTLIGKEKMENAVFAGWFLYLAVVLGLVLVAAIWWSLPRWQLRKFHADIEKPAERADTEDKFRRTVGQILGGAAVLGGLALSLGELQTSREAIRAQGENLLQQRLSQQFTKGLELLGKNMPAETFGGISALEQVAKASPDYHWPVINSLTGYVRHVSRKLENENLDEAKTLSPEIQAILTVIARRTASYDGEGQIDLRRTNLTRVELVKGNLRRAVLDKSNFFGAVLRGADLRQASMRATYLKFAGLEDANLQQANFEGGNLERANLQNANLSYANLTQVVLRYADLQGANLLRTNLTRTNLSTVLGLSEGQLIEACSDGKTELPPGIDLRLRPCDGDK